MTDLAEIAERATPIEMREPLGELLGSVEPGGVVRFTLVDVGKLAGHLCPTVTTAFELTRRALKELYGEETPVRGQIRVRVASAPDAFANGPLGRVIGYITGAAGVDGFRGLSGHHVRQNLLTYDPAAEPFGSVEFTRTDTGRSVKVLALSEKLPPAPGISENLGPSLEGDQAAGERFRTAWAERVELILERAPEFIEVV